jgi:two-component system, LuxR family, sensor kinase FixL
MTDGNDISTNHTDSADSLIRRLGVRYLFVLALVALLMAVDQAVVQPLLVRLNVYAPAINLSGRQRMLSQKLTKAALALQISNDDTVRTACRSELRETLDQWSRAHIALSGHRQSEARTIDSPEIALQWNLLQPHFDAMCAAASRLIHRTDSGGNSDATARAVGEITAHESAFLSTMDQIVKLMESNAAHEINRLRVCALAIAGVVIMLLVGLGWFVVRPATRTIRRQVDDLESHVAQRTRELADALASLRYQIAERETVQLKNKTLSAQLAHADRVASMGHLTIGLAHEINQPLGAIANYAEVCDVMLSQPTESHGQRRLQENIGHIKRASLRAGQIVRRIRNFVKPNPGIINNVYINVLVEEVVALCRQDIIRANVELTLDLSADDGVVSVDPIQIQQVLVNLVQNALQAMYDQMANDRRLHIRTSGMFDTVRVDLVDSGPGFTSADAEAIFEPFHTTKKDGLGIGLAICRSIVERHDGTIWAESSFGNGAQVSFILPRTEPHDSPRPIEADSVCG